MHLVSFTLLTLHFQHLFLLENQDHATLKNVQCKNLNTLY